MLRPLQVLCSALLDEARLKKLGAWGRGVRLVSAEHAAAAPSTSQAHLAHGSGVHEAGSGAGLGSQTTAADLPQSALPARAALPPGLTHLYSELPTHGVAATPAMVRLLRALKSRAAIVFVDTSSAARRIWLSITRQGVEVWPGGALPVLCVERSHTCCCMRSSF